MTSSRGARGGTGAIVILVLVFILFQNGSQIQRKYTASFDGESFQQIAVTNDMTNSTRGKRNETVIHPHLDHYNHTQNSTRNQQNETSKRRERIPTEKEKVTSTTSPALPQSLLDKIKAFMDLPKENRPQPPNTPGAFLHVGKTGGSFLTGFLDNPCHSWVSKPCYGEPRNETYAGYSTTYIHTPDFHFVGDPNSSRPNYYDFDFYVVTLRDPFSKFLSAFTSMHPGNGLKVVLYDRPAIMERCTKLYQCFPSLEKFANDLGWDPSDFHYAQPVDEEINNINVNCTDLARAIMANGVHGQCNTHFLWNTKTILERIPTWNLSLSSSSAAAVAKPLHLLAIRTEHNAKDFVTVNQALGQPYRLEMSDVMRPKSKNTYRIQENLVVTKEISEEGRDQSCLALLPEYKAYMTALARAVNLSDQDRHTSLQLARENCPKLKWLFQTDFWTLLELQDPTPTEANAS